LDEYRHAPAGRAERAAGADRPTIGESIGRPQQDHRAMPDRDPTRPNWVVPLGWIGIGAMAIVGGGAYTIGEFAFYGYEFLPYWPTIGGWMVGMTVFAAAFGTLLEYIIWNGGAARALPFASMWRNLPGVIAAAGILVALAIGCWAAHAQYRCALLSTPFLSVLAFAGITSLQDPIVHVLRQSARPAVALVVLLALEAGLMFAIGEWLAIDHYRKGLDHFQKERTAEWSISGGGADFHIDYARQEIVLRWNAGGSGPHEIRRSLAGLACK
jgi:hypothetical protein